MTAVDAQRLGVKVGHLSFSELRSVEDRGESGNEAPA
jgi:hypothetical protein